MKTGWISLFELLRRIMVDCKSLIAKMCEDLAVKEPHLTVKQIAARETTHNNYDLCNVGTLLAVPWIMPLFE